MRRASINAILTLVFSLSSPFLFSQSTQSEKPAKLSFFAPQLIHCAPQSGMVGWGSPCFRIDVNVLDAESHPARLTANSKFSVLEIQPDSKPWKTLSQKAVNNPGETMALSSDRVYVLALLDTSGSMNEQSGQQTRFAVAKTAAKSILELAKSESGFLAIAPFDSRDVETRIKDVRFTDEVSVAQRQLETLTPPTTGNTALYSAVVAGLQRLSQEKSNYLKVLIVVTDGVNDVGHPGDDPNLLTDVNVAIEKVRTAPITVFTVGFDQKVGGGGVDTEVLRKLASDEGKFKLATNAAELKKEIERIIENVANRFTVTTAVLGNRNDTQNAASGKCPDFASLGPRKFKLRVDAGGNELVSEEFSFFPPAFGPPNPRDGVSEDEHKEWVTECNGDGPGIVWYQIATFTGFTGLIAILWFLVPMFLWPAQSPATHSAPIETIEPIRPVRAEGRPRQAQSPGEAQPSRAAGMAAARGADAGGGAKRAPMDKTNVIRPEGSRLRNPSRGDQDS